MRSALLSLMLVGTLATAPSPAQSEATEVELELLLAIDASTSIDRDEFRLQRKGFVSAFRDPSVQSAISALGSKGMAVALAQWAGPFQQILGIDWHLISSPESANAFADKLEQMDRKVQGFTDIAGALQFSTQQILQNEWAGNRLAIDVSGDGTSDKFDPAPQRDAAIAQGITVNGLVIYSSEYDLGELAQFSLYRHYKERVIGGPGAFLEVASDFEDFGAAIRRKLIREISGAVYTDLPESKASIKITQKFGR